MSVSGRRRISRVSAMMDEDVNPMEGAINIVDAMLVFACGLMLSLVMYWNVDLNSSKTVPVEASSETVSEDELKDDSGDPDAEGSGFEEVGKVFRDPASGKLYMSKDAAEATGAGGIGAGATGRGGS